MSSTYRIRWKGHTDGPFSRDEILLRLARGELSVLHRVEIDGRWQPLSALVESKSTIATRDLTTQVADAAPHAYASPPAHAGWTPEPVTATPARIRIGYFFCGLSFLLPVVATLPAIAIAGWIRRHGYRDAGNAQLALIALFTSLGLGFWHLVRLSFLNGHFG